MISRVFSISRWSQFLLCLSLCLCVADVAQAAQARHAKKVKLPPPPVVAAPMVVATIKPLQLLAAALTDGISAPQVVMDAGQDPHHLSLRPSERQMLEHAGIVLWVGPVLEQPFVKVIDQLVVPVVTAQNVSGIKLLKVGDVTDPHLWLDTGNVRHVAAALLDVLQKQDATRAAAYQANAVRFVTQLDALDAELDHSMLAFKSQPWAVSHQAFRYFAQQRGLQEALALTDSSNNAAGVRAVVGMRQQMVEQHVQCLLTEPSANHQQLNSMFDGINLNIVTGDVLGTSLTPDSNAFVTLLRQLASALSSCMGATHD